MLRCLCQSPHAPGRKSIHGFLNWNFHCNTVCIARWGQRPQYTRLHIDDLLCQIQRDGSGYPFWRSGFVVVRKTDNTQHNDGCCRGTPEVSHACLLFGQWNSVSMPVGGWGWGCSSVGTVLAYFARSLGSIPRAVQNQTGAHPNPNSLAYIRFCLNHKDKKTDKHSLVLSLLDNDHSLGLFLVV